jgi:hypothetical protein
MNGGVAVKIIKRDKHEAEIREDVRAVSVFARGKSVKCPVLRQLGLSHTIPKYTELSARAIA